MKPFAVAVFLSLGPMAQAGVPVMSLPDLIFPPIQPPVQPDLSTQGCGAQNC